MGSPKESVTVVMTHRKTGTGSYSEQSTELDDMTDMKLEKMSSQCLVTEKGKVGGCTRLGWGSPSLTER